MKTFHSLDLPSPPPEGMCFTIGNFDGLHVGHKSVLARLQEKADATGSKTAVITFRNHPFQVLHPHVATCFLSTLEHRIKLFEETRIDYLYLLTFTQEFAQQTAETFLEKLAFKFPLKGLVLGHDAVLGKNRQGVPSLLRKLAREGDYEIDYVNEISYQGTTISSSKVREYVTQGDFCNAMPLLGRPYSIYGRVDPGLGQGKQIGFATANLDLTGLCLPPFGVYAVLVNYKGQEIRGIANLGIAPTLRQSGKVLLEAHLFDFQQPLYNEFIEVIFLRFIRPEKKFENVKDLQLQIGKDISFVNQLFSTTGIPSDNQLKF